MIEKIPFGATGHLSSRIIFGAAALGGLRQEKADSVLSLAMSYGVNHIDVAASYGDAELRLAPFLKDHRKDVFLASKTGDRSHDEAFASIERSLTRMEVDQLDLIQFHNLTQDADWDQVMGDNGALKAALKARSQGMVRYIGVTGHGTRVAEMHLKSLNRFEFDSVLLPYNYMAMQEPRYASEFNELYNLTREKNIAMQTIKAIARRRWRDDDTSKRFSWYEPIRDEDILSRTVRWVLSRPCIFLNSSSDATLLKLILDAASNFDAESIQGLEDAIQRDAKEMAQEPLFIRGQTDEVN